MKKNVLIVDDSATARQYYLDVLFQSGYNVVSAENGADAIAKAVAHSFSLIISDINMPVLDGYSLVRRLRGGIVATTTPIVLISTEDQEQDRSIGFEAGATLYLTKPIETATLIDSVKVLIGE